MNISNKIASMASHSGGTAKKHIWGRKLVVKFKSKLANKMMVFGDKDDSNNLVINVQGNKYLSSLKDEFVLSIYNLTYNEVAKLIAYEYDEVEILAGYESTGVHKIFEGKVLYISNERESRETNVMHVISVSKLMGLYNSRLNLTLNSGINMYAALEFITRRAGIQGSNVSNEFKRKFVTDVLTAKGSVSSFLDAFTKDSASYAVQSDSSQGAIVSIWDMKNHDSRLISITPESGLMINGYPTLTTDGVRFTALPIFNFMPGDTLVIDNRLIDMSVTTVQQATSQQLGLYLDKNNKYLLFELNYDLSNADGSFEIRMKAKSKTLLTNVIGGAAK